MINSPTNIFHTTCPLTPLFKPHDIDNKPARVITWHSGKRKHKYFTQISKDICSKFIFNWFLPVKISHGIKSAWITRQQLFSPQSSLFPHWSHIILLLVIMIMIMIISILSSQSRWPWAWMILCPTHTHSPTSCSWPVRYYTHRRLSPKKRSFCSKRHSFCRHNHCHYHLKSPQNQRNCHDHQRIRVGGVFGIVILIAMLL